MAKISCYDTEGIEHIKEQVDVRECVSSMGWTYNKPEQAVAIAAAQEKPKQTRKPRKSVEDSE